MNTQIKTRLILIFFFFILCLNSKAQEPRGRFLNDTMQIGKSIQFELIYKHPAAMNIFFPTDKKYFNNYELVDIKGFTTKTINNISTDSVIYEIKSFDINKIQYLSLPVFISNGKDCTIVYSKIDSIFCKLKINSLKKESPISMVTFIKFKAIIDFPKFLIYLSVFTIILGLIYLFFGRTINRYIKLFKLSRNQKEFNSNYDKLSLGEINEKKVAKALVSWKNQMQNLEKKPFTTFTSKEINEELKQDDLAQALIDFDMAIYAGVLNVKMQDSMKILKVIANQAYKNRSEQLSNELKQRS